MASHCIWNSTQTCACYTVHMGIESNPLKQNPENREGDTEKGVGRFLENETELLTRIAEGVANTRAGRYIRAATLMTLLAGTVAGCERKETADEKRYTVEELKQRWENDIYSDDPITQQVYEHALERQHKYIERQIRDEREALQIAEEMNIDLYEIEGENLESHVVRNEGKIVQINGINVPEEILEKHYPKPTGTNEKKEGLSEMLESEPIFNTREENEDDRSKVHGGEELKSESY